MISINLVPDVKLEMLRAQRLRNVAISVSIVAGIVAGIIVAVLAIVLGAQATLQAVTNGTIKSEYKKLSSIDGINDRLTIQNQISKISDINDKKTRDSRLLDVLAAINPPAPNDMKFSKVTLNPAESTLTIEGSAEGGYSSAEVFKKTILNIKIEGKQLGADETTTTPLTSTVDLQNPSLGQNSEGKTVLQFTAVFTYPQDLFSNSLSEVRVVTPTDRIDVTDSKTRVPDSLFTIQANTSGSK
jgi:hypothetical protein